ncbi:MAG TPA: efflux RND transporter periplasmic adaptor subunit [Candidatus Eisenbacteria bacterium]|nr:efflux RND transporter periplasmic adaptor subunit [Candidatus Eisenbacteria bacterium]
MAENGKASGAARVRKILRPVLFLLVVGGIVYAYWSYKHRNEGYRGGDISTTGTVEAVSTDLGFKVAGRIADVPVSEGDRVKPGQLVARLETQDLDVALQSAQSSQLAAQAALMSAQATRDKTARDWARQKTLMASDATTEQQVDAARAAANVAVAQVASARAQVAQAKTMLEQAQLNRSYADLYTAQSGQVLEKVHRPGEMVMVGVPVVTVADLDTVKVHAAVDETKVGAVRVGDKVTVRVYSFDNRTFEGVVSDIQAAGDFATRKDWGARRRDIRTFNVTAHVLNPEHLLKDGMTAEVVIRVAPSVARARAGK